MSSVHMSEFLPDMLFNCMDLIKLQNGKAYICYDAAWVSETVRGSVALSRK